MPFPAGTHANEHAPWLELALRSPLNRTAGAGADRKSNVLPDASIDFAQPRITTRRVRVDSRMWEQHQHSNGSRNIYENQ
jgi:hypothetical protein